MVSDEADERVVDYGNEDFVLITEADEILEDLPQTVPYPWMNENFADEKIESDEGFEFQLIYADEGMDVEQVSLIRSEWMQLESLAQEINESVDTGSGALK